MYSTKKFKQIEDLECSFCHERFKSFELYLLHIFLRHPKTLEATMDEWNPSSRTCRAKREFTPEEFERLRKIVRKLENGEGILLES